MLDCLIFIGVTLCFGAKSQKTVFVDTRPGGQSSVLGI